MHTAAHHGVRHHVHCGLVPVWQWRARPCLAAVGGSPCHPVAAGARCISMVRFACTAAHHGARHRVRCGQVPVQQWRAALATW